MVVGQEILDNPIRPQSRHAMEFGLDENALAKLTGMSSLANEQNEQM